MAHPEFIGHAEHNITLREIGHVALIAATAFLLAGGLAVAFAVALYG